jgi:hypothetical protein
LGFLASLARLSNLRMQQVVILHDRARIEGGTQADLTIRTINRASL